MLQAWLADSALDGARLAVVSRGATGASPDRESLLDSSVWGLVRSAQSESPGRVALIDLEASDGTDADASLSGLLRAALGSGEAQLAIRDGGLLVARLAPAAVDELTVPDGDEHWCLTAGSDGTFDGLALEPSPAGSAPLGPRESLGVVWNDGDGDVIDASPETDEEEIRRQQSQCIDTAARRSHGGQQALREIRGDEGEGTSRPHLHRE